MDETPPLSAARDLYTYSCTSRRTVRPLSASHTTSCVTNSLPPFLPTLFSLLRPARTSCHFQPKHSEDDEIWSNATVGGRLGLQDPAESRSYVRRHRTSPSRVGHFRLDSCNDSCPSHSPCPHVPHAPLPRFPSHSLFILCSNSSTRASAPRGCAQLRSKACIGVAYESASSESNSGPPVSRIASAAVPHPGLTYRPPSCSDQDIRIPGDGVKYHVTPCTPIYSCILHMSSLPHS